MSVDATLGALNALTELFERAAGYEGRPRERLLALMEAEELFLRVYPYHSRALQLVRIASQIGRTAQRDQQLTHCESRRIALLTNIISDAVHSGDLEFAGERRPQDLAFMLWSLAFGTRALTSTIVATGQLGIQDGFDTIRGFVDELMDALGWRPLSDAWDYARTRDHLRSELFADYWMLARENTE